MIGLPIVAPVRAIIEPDFGYWHKTDLEISRSNELDREAAVLVNGESFLEREVPFGSPVRGRR
jgi:hypothetical protein